MRNDKRIFALGFFDGVHLGHQALLKECCALAKTLDCQAAAITFDRHPKSMFSPQPPVLISTAPERKRLLRLYGIEQVYQYPVSEQTMSTPWRAFIGELLEYGAAGFVCGADYRFGHRGEGSAEKLKTLCTQLGIPCVIVPDQILEGVRISSTHIRGLIEDGKMESATKFLGHPYTLTGHVVHGKQLGRKLGVPTANLILPEGLAIPKFGVYACRCIVDGIRYCAVTNIGTRPTVNGMGITVEPWILDFEGDLYDREIRLEFYYFLRPEMKFDDLSALRRQIQADAAETRCYFENHTKEAEGWQN